MSSYGQHKDFSRFGIFLGHFDNNGAVASYFSSAKSPANKHQEGKSASLSLL